MNENFGKNSPRIIAITNHKGGVGKTTTVVNLGAALVQSKKKVLLIDLDPQAHLSYSLGIMAHELNKTVYEVLKGELKYIDAIIEENGLFIIPSSLNLSGADMELSGMAGREQLLRKALYEFNGFNGWDFVLIDCPPSLGILTLNALTTANELFIPLQTEYLALQGMSKLLQAVEIVQKRLNHNLKLTGIIATLYDRRKKLNNEIIEKVGEYFGNKLFRTYIRNNVSLAEAPSYGKSIFDYMPGSKGAKDYLSLSKEVIERR